MAYNQAGWRITAARRRRNNHQAVSGNGRASLAIARKTGHRAHRGDGRNNGDGGVETKTSDIWHRQMVVAK